MERVILYSTLCLLVHFAVAEGTSFTKPCDFTGTPDDIVVSNDENLGRFVCISQADTRSSVTGLWQFISCPGANNFRVKSSNVGGAKFCLEHDGRPGIGIDFESGEATVKVLMLACETENGTTLNVVDITVYFRRDGFIMYVAKSKDGNVSVSLGDTIIIAQFVGLERDLDTIEAPDGVNCTTTPEADNCRFIGGESEKTMTCMVTPQSETDGGMKVFSGPSGPLATVTVNINANPVLTTPTEEPPSLGPDSIIGLAVGITTSVILLLIFIAIIIITFFIIVWRVGPRPKSSPTQGDVESGDGPPSHFNYVAFGEGIPQEVKSHVVNRSNVEEFRLNGRTVEDRFREGNEKIMFVTTFGEYEAAPGSSLVAQIQQLEATQGDRVHIVKLSDEELQSTDGELPAIPIILDHLRQQPATPSTTILTVLQSIHEMLFRMRTQDAPSVSNNTAEEGNGHCPHHEEQELPNRQPPRDEDGEPP